MGPEQVLLFRPWTKDYRCTNAHCVTHPFLAGCEQNPSVQDHWYMQTIVKLTEAPTVLQALAAKMA